MKFKTIFRSLSNLLFITPYLISAKTDECFEIYNKFDNEIEVKRNIYECTVNENGELNSL